MKALHIVAFILLVVGGLNWLLTALWSTWDLGSVITPTGAMIVYILVGLSAIWEVVTHSKNCRACSAAPMSGTSM